MHHRHVPDESTVLQKLPENRSEAYQSPPRNDAFGGCDDSLITDNVATHAAPVNSDQKPDLDAKICQTIQVNYSQANWSHRAFQAAISTVTVSDPTYLCHRELEEDYNTIFQTLCALFPATKRHFRLPHTRSFLRKAQFWLETVKVKRSKIRYVLKSLDRGIN